MPQREVKFRERPADQVQGQPHPPSAPPAATLSFSLPLLRILCQAKEEQEEEKAVGARPSAAPVQQRRRGHHERPATALSGAKGGAGSGPLRLPPGEIGEEAAA